MEMSIDNAINRHEEMLSLTVTVVEDMRKEIADLKKRIEKMEEKNE